MTLPLKYSPNRELKHVFSIKWPHIHNGNPHIAKFGIILCCHHFGHNRLTCYWLRNQNQWLTLLSESIADWFLSCIRIAQYDHYYFTPCIRYDWTFNSHHTMQQRWHSNCRVRASKINWLRRTLHERPIISNHVLMAIYIIFQNLIDAVANGAISVCALVEFVHVWCRSCVIGVGIQLYWWMQQTMLKLNINIETNVSGCDSLAQYRSHALDINNIWLD